MPNTPPKTDPSLERLARVTAQRVAREISYLDPGPPAIEVCADIILQTLAPLGGVVRYLRDTTDTLEQICHRLKDDERLQMMVSSWEFDCRRNRKALANLDAGREE